MSHASKSGRNDGKVRLTYHKVRLQTRRITAELTSTTRVRFHRHSSQP